MITVKILLFFIVGRVIYAAHFGLSTNDLDSFDPDEDELFRSRLCDDINLECKFSEPSNKTVIPTMNGDKFICGHRSIKEKEEERDILRERSYYGEFPWMVAVLAIEGNLYMCGGSIIHHSVVLTSAYCVIFSQASEIKVRAGDWDATDNVEVYADQESFVKNLAIHEDFKVTEPANDIALLFLKWPFELAVNVQPICLPPPNSKFDLNNCIATGWGVNKKKTCRGVLRKADLLMLPRKSCESILRRTELGPAFEFHPSLLCTATGDCADMCGNDIGSPLICPIRETVTDRYYQVGIFSWRISCENHTPAVFVSIPHMRFWINEKLAEKNLDTENFIY